MLDLVRRSIRRKLTLLVLGTTFVALLVAGGALLLYSVQSYRQAAINDLKAQADTLGHASAPALSFDDPKLAREYLALLKDKHDIAEAAIYNANGKLFASYARSASARFPPLPDLDGVHVEGGNIVLFRRITENNEIRGAVYLRADYALYTKVWHFLEILALVMTLAMVSAIAMSAWLQRAVTGPILAISALAREVMDRRDFGLRARKTTDDEIGDLADAFNGMLAEVGTRAASLERLNQSLQHEMSQRQQAEEALRKANLELEQRVAARTSQLEAANKELEGFSYSVSHDLRAPLRAIAGFTGAIFEDHDEELSEEAKRKLGIVRDDAARMGGLIDDLLAFSRMGRAAIQLAELDMTALASTTLERLRSEQGGANGADVRLAVLPAARGDRGLVGQVWANLLSNALKYSSKAERPVIEVNAVSDAAENIYFVRDNGVGFDPKYQAKLFGVFQRLHDESEFPGTGVGLALVARIVARHGGRVWATGQPDAGATFYFTLPKEPSDGAV